MVPCGNYVHVQTDEVILMHGHAIVLSISSFVFIFAFFKALC